MGFRTALVISYERSTVEPSLVPQTLRCLSAFSGCRLICKLDFADAKFSLYFLGYHSADAIPEDPQERVSVPSPPSFTPTPSRVSGSKSALRL